MTLSADERKEILELLANGKISAESAATLLSESARSTAGSQAKGDSATGTKSGSVGDTTTRRTNEGPSWFRIQVSDLSTGKSKVKVKIPLGMLRFGLDFGRRFAPELDELDFEQLHTFAGREDGLLVDVQDEEDGEHVRVFVD